MTASAAAFIAAKKIEPAVLLGWRLTPDMFALSRQVQVACDQAKNGIARLAGVQPPTSPVCVAASAHPTPPDGARAG